MSNTNSTESMNSNLLDLWESQISNFKSEAYQPSILEPVLGTVAYGLIVYALKQYNANQKAKGVEKEKWLGLAVIHNVNLIVLSVLTGLGASYEMFMRGSNDGFDGLFCSGSVREPGTALDGAAGFWVKVYYLSKYYEFGDTFLLCLKGLPTIPLHLYHHCVMIWVMWMSCRYDVYDCTAFCVIINSIIHTFMYIYYLFATLGHRVWWKKYLTAGQIVQFLTAFVYANISLYVSYTRQGRCGGSERVWVILIGQTVNISFVVLFSFFFNQTYKPKEKVDATGNGKESKKEN